MNMKNALSIVSSVLILSGGAAFARQGTESGGSAILNDLELGKGSGIFDEASSDTANGGGHIDACGYLENGNNNIFRGGGSISDSAVTLAFTGYDAGSTSILADGSPAEGSIGIAGQGTIMDAFEGSKIMTDLEVCNGNGSVSDSALAFRKVTEVGSGHVSGIGHIDAGIHVE